MAKNSIEGTIIRGLGEGTFFMSMPHYQKEINEKLGFTAYPGTLNLKIGKNQKESLKNFSLIRIDGFKQENKTFGGADCYKARIGSISGAIIIPHLTKHKDIIEIIAPVHVKSELRLEDGDKLKVELI